MRRLISSGSTFEKDIGYSRAVVDGEWVFVSGTTARFGDVRPAATMFSAGLADPRMRIEIEVTARRPRRKTPRRASAKR